MILVWLSRWLVTPPKSRCRVRAWLKPPTTRNASMSCAATDMNTKRTKAEVVTMVTIMIMIAAINVDNITRRVGNILLQEIANAPLINEADAGAVFFLMIVQADIFSQRPNLRLVEIAQRKKAVS